MPQPCLNHASTMSQACPKVTQPCRKKPEKTVAACKKSFPVILSKLRRNVSPPCRNHVATMSQHFRPPKITCGMLGASLRHRCDIVGANYLKVFLFLFFFSLIKKDILLISSLNIMYYQCASPNFFLEHLKIQNLLLIL